MSKYTIELGTLKNLDYPLKLIDYPIFNESYRQLLNDKIINHYFFHEIGFETPDRFNHYLSVRMNDIMPYYNQLYKSELLAIDPLYTTNIEKIINYTGTESNLNNLSGNKTIANDNNTTQTNNLTTTNEIANNSSGSHDTDATLTKYENDTPQTPVKKNYLSDDDFYLTKFNQEQSLGTDTSTTEETSNSTTANTGTVTNEQTDNGTISETKATTNTLTKDLEDNQTIKGNEGISQSELLMKYRETFLNIDLLILGELENLFMGVY